MAATPVAMPPGSRHIREPALGYDPFPIEVLYEQLPRVRHERRLVKVKYWSGDKLSVDLDAVFKQFDRKWFKAVRIKYNLHEWNDIIYHTHLLANIEKLEKELTNANAC